MIYNKAMKRILSIILLALLTINVGYANAEQLWQYGSFSERAQVAKEIGIVSDTSEYKGSLEQNLWLLAWYADNQEISQSFGATLPIAGSTYNLAGSGVTGSATSITLQSLTITQSGQKILDADLSDTFYITLEPGNRNRQEIVSCTTVVQNGNGTATLSGCSRGLSPISPYTASSTLQFSHAGGSQVVFSDPPQLFNSYGALADDETITGNWKLGTDCTGGSANDEVCAKAYIDSVGSSGAADANETTKGISELATENELIAGTSAGGTSARLVIPNSLATSTPSGGTSGAKRVVVSESDGKINQLWLDLLGESWDFRTSSSTNATFGNATSSGPHIFQGVVSGLSPIGDGSDGAFTATSTSRLTTSKIWNFTSLTVGGGNTLSTDDLGTILHIRVQGVCNIAGTINLSGLGGRGGAAAAAGSSTINFKVASTTIQYGRPGGTASGTQGAAGGALEVPLWYANQNRGLKLVFPGTGGGGGGNGSSGGTGGTGGHGGGALILECNELSGAGTINVSGTNGAVGTEGGGTQAGSGGGGGGGMALVVWTKESTWSGTSTFNGGTGGVLVTGGSANAGTGGGGGGSYAGAGTAGQNCQDTCTDGGAGGAGANGVITIQRREY